MKKKCCFVFASTLLVLFIMNAAGCGLSTEDIEEQVIADIESNWAEQGLEGVTIDDLTLVKKSKNEYRGILEISAYGESETVTINVMMDGDSFMWEIEDW